MTNIRRFCILYSVLASLLLLTQSFAQEGFDDEEVVVFLKKIRDDESNYLREVTKAAAREISKTGEFLAKPYKRNVTGPTVSVDAPQFSFTPHKTGLSTKEMASAGLSLVSDIGSIFGKSKESQKANELNAKLSNNEALAGWGKNEKMKVSMRSKVTLFDNDSGDEIIRTINVEQVFNSKDAFLQEKESMIQEAIVGEVKKVLVEYLEDDSGF